jgi:hypothetical protein
MEWEKFFSKQAQSMERKQFLLLASSRACRRRASYHNMTHGQNLARQYRFGSMFSKDLLGAEVGMFEAWEVEDF